MEGIATDALVDVTSRGEMSVRSKKEELEEKGLPLLWSKD